MDDKKRSNCIEKNGFDCDDIHCMYYDICTKESTERFKEEWQNLRRKAQEEEEAIRKIIKIN